MHYFEGFVLDAGHTVQAVESDYGYDLLLFTYDTNGFLEPDLVYLQFKAAESLLAVGSAYVFDLDVRDYNLWMLDNLPVTLSCTMLADRVRIGLQSSSISAKMKRVSRSAARRRCECTCRLSSA